MSRFAFPAAKQTIKPLFVALIIAARIAVMLPEALQLQLITTFVKRFLMLVTKLIASALLALRPADKLILMGRILHPGAIPIIPMALSTAAAIPAQCVP